MDKIKGNEVGLSHSNLASRNLRLPNTIRSRMKHQARICSWVNIWSLLVIITAEVLARPQNSLDLDESRSRLISLSQSVAPTWLSRPEVDRLIQNQKPFMDITDHYSKTILEKRTGTEGTVNNS